MQEINGFVVIGDIWVSEKYCYKCNALCKICKKEFITNYHALHRMKSCGCGRPRQLAELGEYVNGFKILKDYAYTKFRLTRWALVECKVCHNSYEVAVNNLKYRKHCGCIKRGVIASKYAKTHPQLCQSYQHMLKRCYNKNDQDYYNYGARGILVCEEWLKDRNTFCEWSLKNGYENNKKLSIDRIDNDKDYSPDNCRWSNAAIQARNTRRNVLTMELAAQMRKDCKLHTLRDLAIKYKVSYGTVSNVINNKSWIEI